MVNKYSIFNGAKYFFSDGLQNYLVFISTRHINLISKDGSDRRINFGVTIWIGLKYRVFSGPYFHVFGWNTDIYSVNARKLKRTVKVLSVDYNAIDTSNIWDIHIYLMKEA